MKPLLTILALLALAATAAGLAGYRLGNDPALRAAAARGDTLEWLRTDFRLTDAQFAAIRQKHDAYGSVCEEHCRAIQEAMRARAEIATRPGSTPEERAAAEQQVERLREICETAINRHVREVAALMSPAEGERYLALVLPLVPDFDHRAAPDLGLGHAHTH